MPYIRKEDRPLLDEKISALVSALYQVVSGEGNLPAGKRINGSKRAGTLNYVITRLVDEVLNTTALRASYSDYNEVLGVLEAVKQEIYRRVISGYEDKKKEENGDVYTKV